MTTTTKCETCKRALQSDITYSKLQIAKSWGKLMNASKDVIDTILICEKSFQYLHNTVKNYDRICILLCIEVSKTVFKDTTFVLHDRDIVKYNLVTHRDILIRNIVHRYVKIKFFQISENENKLGRKNIRAKFSKLILFSNQ